jgi:hypothetical protein
VLGEVKLLSAPHPVIGGEYARDTLYRTSCSRCLADRYSAVYHNTTCPLVVVLLAAGEFSY